VAIKFLSPEDAGTEASSARFLHEGRALARIKSDHVARIMDVDVIPSGLPYIVMEYLEGQDLAQVLRQRGPLQVGRGVDYIMQALEALAEAHSLHIVHRDLKPSNLFLVQRADGAHIKVIDFGIAKSIGHSEETALTKRHAILGSPTYMSPEQASSALAVDART